MNPIEVLNNSRPVQGAVGGAGALASVSLAAVSGQRYFFTQIEADYSAQPAAGIKTVTLKFGGVAVFVWRWDFTKGPFSKNFGSPWHSDYSQAAYVELEGTGGAETGRVGVNVAIA